jgi:hypothetical protein
MGPVDHEGEVLISVGDVSLQMSRQPANEAIVSYNAARVRPGDTQSTQIGLAKAFLIMHARGHDFKCAFLTASKYG